MLWWRITKRNADLKRELQSDLTLDEEEQRDRGLSSGEARYAALQRFWQSHADSRAVLIVGLGIGGATSPRDEPHALNHCRHCAQNEAVAVTGLIVVLRSPHYVAVAQGFQKSDHVVNLCVGPGWSAAYLPRQRLINHIDIAAQGQGQIVKLIDFA
jgi:hypothetical protein